MALAPFITARESPYLSKHNTGLGNVLFQIASTYGLSKMLKKGVSYHFLAQFGDILQDRFGYNHKETIFRNFLEMEYTGQPWLLLWEEDGGQYKFDSTLANKIHTTRYSVLKGYFEYYGYFRDCAEEIRARLQPDKESLQLLQSRYPFLFTDRNTVSVHFRLHEYATKYKGSYYEKAIEYAKANIENPLFVIFTDDPKGLRLRTIGLEGAHIMSNEADYLDLWAMSFCKHNITSLSTFSFWGTFLNPNPNKIVISDKTCHRGWYPDSVKI